MGKRVLAKDLGLFTVGVTPLMRLLMSYCCSLWLFMHAQMAIYIYTQWYSGVGELPDLVLRQEVLTLLKLEVLLSFRNACSGSFRHHDTMDQGFDFMQQYVSFKDLLTFRSNLDSDVSVMTCSPAGVYEIWWLFISVDSFTVPPELLASKSILQSVGTSCQWILNLNSNFLGVRDEKPATTVHGQD